MAVLFALALGLFPQPLPSQPFHAIMPRRLASIDRPDAPKGNRAGRRRDAKLKLSLTH